LLLVGRSRRLCSSFTLLLGCPPYSTKPACQRTWCATKPISRSRGIARTIANARRLLFLCELSASCVSCARTALAESVRGASNETRLLPPTRRCAPETAAPAEDHTLSLRRVTCTRALTGGTGDHAIGWKRPSKSPTIPHPKTLWLGGDAHPFPSKSPSIPIQSPSKTRLVGQSAGRDDHSKPPERAPTIVTGGRLPHPSPSIPIQTRFPSKRVLDGRF